MSLSQKQRAFLRDAARPEAWIERRHSWLVVSYPDPDDPEYRLSGAALRGGELGELRRRGLCDSDELMLTDEGQRVGERLLLLYELLEQVGAVWVNAACADKDIRQLLSAFEGELWKKIEAL